MWICKKCKEENEDSFDSCWKCQTFSEIGDKKSKEYHKDLKKENEQISKEKERDSLIYEELDKKIIQIWLLTIFGGVVIGSLILMILITLKINLPQILVVVIVYYSSRQIKKYYTNHLKEKIIEKLDQKIK